MRGFTLTDTVILVLYLLGILIAGLFFSNKEFKGKDYFKGDGTIPWWVTSVSIFATLLSPISFLAIPGLSYKGTWLFWWAQLGMLIAIPLTIKYFLPLYANLKIDTAYQYLEQRFQSKALRILGALAFISFQLGRISIIMYLPCIALSSLTGLNVDLLILIMGVIAIIYSYKGGLKAVVYTDFIQGFILIVGIAVTFIIMLNSIAGGFDTLWYTLTVEHKFLAVSEPWLSSDILANSILIVLVGGGLTTFATYVSSQDIVQRFTTTTDLKQLDKMTVFNGILSLGVGTLFYLLGTGLYIFYQQHPALLMQTKQDLIFASYITFELPPGITGILLAAIYAAAQSTLSSGINSIATSWMLDIQPVFNNKLTEKQTTHRAQLISLAVGILSVITAFAMAHSDIKSAYEWFNSFAGLALGALAGIFILGAFSRKTNALSAFLGFIISTLTVIYIKFNLPEISFWTYTAITIAETWIIAHLWCYLTRSRFQAPADTTYKK